MRSTSSIISLLTLVLTCLPVTAQPTTRSATTPATTRAAVRPSAQLLSTTELSRRSEIAIAQGVKYLLSKQVEDGWVREDREGFGIGPTALVTFALLACGEQPQSPALTRAINLLKRVNGRDADKAVYSVGLRASVWSLLPESMRAAELRGDLNWLLGHMMTGNMRGIYNYGTRDIGDYSNSQYGVLGVWAAADAGLEVPPAYWRSVEAAWLRGQQNDGGWGYRPNQSTASYASMTAAAVATLFITNDYLHTQDYQDLTKDFRNEPLENGLKWLATNFAPDDNSGYDLSRLRQRRAGGGFGGGRPPFGGRRGPAQQEPDPEVPTRDPGDPFLNYMLFSYERVGEASGLSRWGEHRWYEEGAEQLVKTQQYNGSWIGRNNPEIETAYALLFLARGRAPVIAQKLKFGERWNNRPRDLAGFARFMRRATERHVNWQIVPIDAKGEEFRNAPLLYAASDTAINLTDDQKKTLKSYIDQGGLLIAANEGKMAEFSKSIIALCSTLYPQYAFRDLPKEHPIYTANFSVKTPTTPIRGLSNGLRELVVLFPNGDLPWQWHSTSGVSAQNSPYATLANLWLYATDRANPRLKGEDVWVDRNPAVQPTRSLRVARISYGGNWDPEPAGWTRLGNILANFDQLELTVSSTAGALGSDVGLAHLTGNKAFTLSPAMIAAFKTYLAGGGLLLMDAAGGSAEVPASFEQLIRTIAPDATISPLPLTHPIYHAVNFGGQDIESVDYRRVPNSPVVHIPRLRGAYAQGKLIAIISNEDISGGLVGYSHAGLVGYTPASATDLMRNIILWRASGAKPKP